MTLPFWCLLVGVLLPYVWAFSRYPYLQEVGGPDPKQPRAQAAKLTGKGARTVAAQENAWEALTIFERHESQIALVLSDMVMPEMGGQALFQALRQRDATAKVVLLTGHSLEKELENLRAQGASGWLLKPLRLEQLSQVVAQALGDE